jgi:hypothetical protein
MGTLELGKEGRQKEKLLYLFVCVFHDGKKGAGLSSRSELFLSRTKHAWPTTTREYREASFSSGEKLKIFQDSPSHQIFARIHEVLNVGKKITNCTVCL